MSLTEKYVTVDGAGDHDGSSEANAWTFAEMIAATFTGCRVNIKSGSYSTAIASLPVGAATTPNIYQGYNATPGDLALAPTSMRANSGTGALVTTNWPVITCTGVLTLGAYSVIRHVSLTSALTSGVGTLSVLVDAFAVQVVSTLTGTGAASTSAISIGSSSYGAVTDCDAINTANAGYGIQLGRGQVAFCRIRSANGNAINASSGVGSSVTRCAIYSSSRGVASAGYVSISECTFWNIANGAVYQSGAGNIVVANCLASNCKYMIENATVIKDNISMFNAAGNFKSGGARFLNGGDYPDIGAISLTADPFTDATSGDFRISSSAADLANLRDLGLWFSDVGVLQTPHGSGGGIICPPKMDGGLT